MNYRLLVLLEKILGKGKTTSGTNVAFFSPFCSHHKPKLEINLDTVNGKNPWHCWVSNEKGKTIYSLFRKLKVDKKFYDELNDCVDNTYKNFVKKDESTIQLPIQFKPLANLNKSDLAIPQVRHALIYLNKRKINVTDIKRYNIGICIDGEYKNRIIVPSYDSNGNLNYFVSRAFLKDEYIKYKNPKNSKSIVPFELYINWALPVYLVEGVFDAIAVKFNAIPLLGKTLPEQVKKKILEEKPPAVYVALDIDAKKDALQIVKVIRNIGIPVYYVNLNEKDPSEIGHHNFFNQVKNTELCSPEELLKLELSL